MTLNNAQKAIPWPQPGYNCNPEYAMAQKKTQARADPDGLEHCPDFDERFTLANGRDKAIPYPQTGYNCNADYQLISKSQKQSLAQELPKFDPMALEHCPDFDERMTLTDGKTVGIPYPKEGFNCNAEWALSQKK